VRSRDLRASSHSICSVRGLTSTFFELVTGELLRSDVVIVDAGSFEDCP
jgi:hypothetical protein